VLERDGSDNLLASYTHEGGSLFHDLISVERSNSDYWYLFDGLGSVTEMVDSNENTQNSYRYEAWGQVKSSSENVTNPYRYVGAYGVHWDSGPALHFMQARYYAANVARFITTDPLRGAPQDPSSFHRYLYARNNPCNEADPVGLRSIRDCMKECMPDCVNDLSSADDPLALGVCEVILMCCLEQSITSIGTACCTAYIGGCIFGGLIGEAVASVLCGHFCTTTCLAERPACAPPVGPLPLPF